MLITSASTERGVVTLIKTLAAANQSERVKLKIPRSVQDTIPIRRIYTNGIFWGLGYWTRSNVEICMLATKGHPKRVAKNIHQVIISHVEEHSKKPAEARRRIEALMGDVPKIELFARRPARGWDVWGNEVVSDIVMKENDGID